MTKFKEWNLGEPISLLVGGTPCQAFSVAGLRHGLADARGNLTLTFVEMADHFDPEWIVWENVPGVLSSKDNAFGCFLAGLCGADDPLVPDGKWASAGVVSGPKRTVSWRVLDAQYFGVAQRRRRIFVCAVRGAGNWRAAATLFPVGESLFGDTAPSRQAGQGTTHATAPCLTSSGRGVERTGDTRGQDPVVAVGLDVEICGTLTAGFGKVGAPEVDAYTCIPAYGIPGNWIGRAPENGGNAVEPMHDVAPCLTKTDQHGVAHPTYSVCCGSDPIHAKELAQPITRRNGDPGTIAQQMAVRRLTPVECERLQGFPDNYTNIPWRKKPDAPDGPRYKALGNSMAVPVMNWIGRRIAYVAANFA